MCKGEGGPKRKINGSEMGPRETFTVKDDVVENFHCIKCFRSNGKGRVGKLELLDLSRDMSGPEVHTEHYFCEMMSLFPGLFCCERGRAKVCGMKVMAGRRFLI